MPVEAITDTPEQAGGDHVFPQAGSDTVTATLNLGQATFTASRTLAVAPAPLHVVAVPPFVLSGPYLSRQVLTSFTTPDLLATVASFQASIDWGDQTTPAAGTVTLAADGTFLVSGSHRYPGSGSFAITIRITDAAGVVYMTAVPVDVSGVGWTIQSNDPLAYAGQAPGPLRVGTLTAPGSSPLSYSARVRLGANSTTEPASIQGTATPGTFAIVLDSPPIFPTSGDVPFTLLVSDQSELLASYNFPAGVQRASGTIHVGESRAWTVATYLRGNDPERAQQLSVGQATVDLNTGGLQLTHALDFDLSPGTSVGGNPALVFTSTTVNVHPVIEFALTNTGPTPSQIQIAGSWRLPGTTPVAFTVSQAVPNSPTGPGWPTYLVAAQLPTQVTQTGFYSWTATIRFVYGQGANATTVVLGTQRGSAPVVVNDGPTTPFGVGWGLSGLDRLLPNCAGDQLAWLSGTGDSRLFTRDDAVSTATAAVYRSPEDFGTLIRTGDAISGYTYSYVSTLGVTWTFDNAGRLQTIRDRHQLGLTYTYGANDQLLSVQAPDGASTTFQYSPNQTTIVEPGGRNVLLTLDGSHNLVKIVNQDGTYGDTPRTLVYAAGSHLVQEDQWSPLDTTFTYAPNQDWISTINLGLGSQYQITPAVAQTLGPVAKTANQVQATVADPRTNWLASPADPSYRTSYTLDSRGRALEIDRPLGVTETWVRDGHGQVTTYTDPLRRQTRYQYDYSLGTGQRGDLRQVTYPDQSSEDYQYDTNFALVTAHVYENQHGTTHVYDPLTGDLQVATDAAGNQTIYTYDQYGFVLSVQDPNGHTTHYTYDQYHRLQTTTNALNQVTRYGYDSYGNLQTTTQPTTADGLVRITTAIYDARNQLREQDDPAGGRQLWVYNPYGQVTQEIDLRNQQYYQALQAKGPAAFTQFWQQLYNDNFQNGQITVHAYDQRGWQTTLTEAQGTSVQRQTISLYDLAGNLQLTIAGLAATNAHLVVTASAYDALNRQTAQTELIDDAGVTWQNGTLWDSQGNPIDVTHLPGRITRYAYDAAGNLLFRTAMVGPQDAPTTQITSYAYDARDRQTHVYENWSTDAWTGVHFDRDTETQYDPAGNVLFVTSGRSDNRSIASHPTTTAYQYDAANRVVQTTAASGTSDARITQSAYDAAGNLLAQYTPLSGALFQYTIAPDGLYQTLKPTGQLQVFAYDAVNDKTAVYENPTLLLPQNYDPSGKSLAQLLHDMAGLPLEYDRLTTFGYDEVGNLVSQTVGLSTSYPSQPTTTHYAYDLRDRQIQTYNNWTPGSGGAPASYDRLTETQYDGAGHPVQTTTGEALIRPHVAVTRVAYDALNRVATTYVGFRTPEQTQSHTDYDAADNVTLITTGISSNKTYDHHQTTTFAYDGLNRRTSQTENPKEDNGTPARATLSTYDLADNLISTAVTDSTGNHKRTLVTRYGYDSLNHQTLVIVGYQAAELGWATSVRSDDRDVAIQTESRTIAHYDAADNLIQQIVGGQGPNDPAASALRKTTDVLYDNLNRKVLVREVAWNPSYDEDGDLLATSNSVRITVYGYDPFGNLAYTLTPTPNNQAYVVGGQTYQQIRTEYHSDSLNRRTQVTEAVGIAEEQRTTKFAYDALDQQILQIDPLNVRTVTQYDAFGNVKSVTRATDTTQAVTTETVRDAAGNVVRIRAGLVSAANAQANQAIANYVHVTTTASEYDALNRPTLVIQGDPTNIDPKDPPRVQRSIYDAASNLVESLSGISCTQAGASIQESPATVRHSRDYDALNRLVVQADSIDFRRSQESVTKFAYDNFDRMLARTYLVSGDQVATTYEYDALGRLLVVHNPPTVNYVGAVGEAAPREVIERRADTVSAYDSLNHQILMDGNGATIGYTQTQFDGFGNKVYSRIVMQQGTTTGAAVTHLTYDKLGNLLSVTDPDNNVTRYEYNALNENLFIRHPDGGVVNIRVTDHEVDQMEFNASQFLYYADGKVHCAYDRDNHTIVYNYDSLGQLREKVLVQNSDHDRQRSTYSYVYDSSGNLLSATAPAAAGRTFTDGFAYNARNEMQSVTDSYGVTLFFTYDASGNRTGVYDNIQANGAITVTGPTGGSIVSAYNSANLLQTRTFTNGDSSTRAVSLQVGLAYDSQLLLREEQYRSVSGGQSQPIYQANYEYDGTGHTAAIVQQIPTAGGNHQLTRYQSLLTGYQSDGAVQRQFLTDNAAAGGLVLSLVTYTYDTGDEIASQTSAVQGGGSTTTANSWDANGNVATGAGAGQTHAEPGNRVTLIVQPMRDESGHAFSQTTHLFYDAAGNVVEKRVDRNYTREYFGFAWKYDYDAENRLTQVQGLELINGRYRQINLTDYTYDALGRRLSISRAQGARSTTTQTEFFAYDGGNVYADLRSATATTYVAARRYVWGDGTDQLFAYVGQTSLTNVQDQGVIWYAQDRQGSVRTLLDQTGHPVQTYGYDAFGKFANQLPPAAAAEEPIYNRYGYTGREFDIGVGLDYNHARFYDPQVQRWISQDPQGFAAGDTNLYRYAFNSPTNLRDPSGRDVFDSLVGAIGWENVRSWDNVLGSYHDGWFTQTSNFAAGAGDTVSGGLTSWVRQRLGYDDVVNYQSDAYHYGTYAGQAINIGLTVANPVCGARAVTAGLGFFSRAVGSSRLLGTAFNVVRGLSTAGGLLNAGQAALNGDWSGAAMAGAGAGLSALRGVNGCLGTVGYVGATGLLGYGSYQEVRQGLNSFDNGDVLGGLLHMGQAAANVMAWMGVRNSCFTGEMAILARGSWGCGSRRIDQIAVGDEVLSRPEDKPDGPLSWKRVEDVFVLSGVIFHLHVGGQVIRTTPEHPFYVYDKGWVAAAELQIGDLLSSHDGQWVAVEDLLDTGEYEVVYNLRVADYHTYFVGSAEWGFSVWAHNAGSEYGTQQRQRLTRQQGQDIIDEVQQTLPQVTRDNRVMTLTQLENGRHVLTIASGQRTSTDNRTSPPRQFVQEEYVIPRETAAAARTLLRQQLGDEAVLLVPSQRTDGGYIRVADRILPGAPGDSGWHGEGRGIQAGLMYESPAQRQWSSLGTPESSGFRGAACPNCETLQQQYGVSNETGFQSRGGRGSF